MATTAKGKEATIGKEKRGLSPSGPRKIEQKRGLSPSGPRKIEQKRGLSPSGPRKIEQKRGLSPLGGPTNTDQATRIRTPKSSNGSPDTNHLILSEKPVPNYLKPTISSRLDVYKPEMKQTADDKMLLRRRSLDKPASPSQLYKTRTLSPSPIQKTSTERAMKSLSSSPKSTSSPRTVPILKTSRSGKFQPIVSNSNSNSKIINRSPSSTIKKEAKVTNSSSTTPSSTDANKQSEVKPEKKEIEEEKVIMETEEVLLEDPPVSDLKSVDLPDPELEIPDEVQSEPCVCSTFAEEQEHIIFEAPQIEEAKEKSHDDDHHDEDVYGQEHEGNNNKITNNGLEDIAEQPQEILASDEQQEKGEAEGKDGENATDQSPNVHKADVAPVEDSGDDISPTKVNFNQGKLLEEAEEEEGDGELPKLKLNEREDVEVNEEAKLERENVVSKRQDAHGKKESPVYNDVIEETASKLGRNKSMVKALVGAFEVVISLEEGQTPRADESGEAGSPGQTGILPRIPSPSISNGSHVLEVGFTPHEQRSKSKEGTDLSGGSGLESGDVEDHNAESPST